MAAIVKMGVVIGVHAKRQGGDVLTFTVATVREQ